MEIQKLFVSLLLDAADYVGGLDDAQKQAQTWSGRLRQSIGSGIQTAGKIATGALLGVGAAAVGAFAMAGNAAIDMNATLETSTLQFETLMGDADRAQEHVASLFEFAKKTPFETQPIIDASRMLQTFGGDALNTMDNLTLLGDAAAATNAPFDELGFWAGRMYSAIQGGQPFGEAAMRLQELAVLSPEARKQMEELQAAGGDASDIFAIFQGDLGKFTGAMEKQAGTWQGLKSTIIDALNITAAQALRPFFDLAKEGWGWLANFLSSDAVTTGVEMFAAGLQGIGEGAMFFVEALRQGYEPATAFSVAWGMIGSSLGLTGEQIQVVREFILGLAEQVTAVLGPVIAWTQNNVELQDVLIVLAGVIAVTVLPILFSLLATIVSIAAPIVAAIAIVALLRQAWENDWGGIQEKTAAVWAFIEPLLQTAWQWLSVNVPAALEVLRAFWVDTAWPAIQNAIQVVWPIIQTIFAAISDFVVNTLVPTIKNLYTQWTTVWWPAISEQLEVAWSKISPVFEQISDFIKNDLGPTINAFKVIWAELVWPAIQQAIDSVWQKIKPIFDFIQQYHDVIMKGAVEGFKNAWEQQWTSIGNKISAVWESISQIFQAIRNFGEWIRNNIFEFKINLPKLPDWALPGSPLPIHTAWKAFAEDMNRTTISPTVNLAGVAPAPLPSPGAGGGDTRTVNYNVQANYGYQSESSLRDDIRLLQIMST